MTKKLVPDIATTKIYGTKGTLDAKGIIKFWQSGCTE